MRLLKSKKVQSILIFLSMKTATPPLIEISRRLVTLEAIPITIAICENLLAIIAGPSNLFLSAINLYPVAC